MIFIAAQCHRRHGTCETNAETQRCVASTELIHRYVYVSGLVAKFHSFSAQRGRKRERGEGRESAHTITERVPNSVALPVNSIRSAQSVRRNASINSENCFRSALRSPLWREILLKRFLESLQKQNIRIACRALVLPRVYVCVCNVWSVPWMA